MRKISILSVPYFLLVFFFGAGKFTYAQPAEEISIVPYPQILKSGKGSFKVSSSTVVSMPATMVLNNEAQFLSQMFSEVLGKPLPVKFKQQKNSISLHLDPSISSPEGYSIQVKKEGVRISANSPSGIFLAIQTIRQLLPASIEVSGSKRSFVSLPVLEINDAPAFEWRGMHLDVSRHFFSMDYLKKLIDMMSLYKFNKFHLHLTDDQGWRIEIRKYPKLTEEGAWRSFNNQDSVVMERAKTDPGLAIDPAHIIQKNGKPLYGGYYTQQQLKELVRYASAKHIEIIPEIDMPGHMMAAINAYNFLSCDGSSTFGEYFSTPICPCLPSTYRFAEDIFSEVMEIFPSKYIHIGGDEVDRIHWERSEACKDLMQKEGMTSTAELQSRFINHMDRFFSSRGKRLIGWDEILEGGIHSNAVIMYWRTWVNAAPLNAARNGNKVIMAPNNPFYFSDQPDKNSLSAVYHYQLIPKDFSVHEAKSIIGGQGNLWTEYIANEKRADYLFMPRMSALAENLWTGKQDFSSYLRRMKAQYARLDHLNVNYRIPDLPLLDNYAFPSTYFLNIAKPLDDLTIRYTVDGSAPSSESEVLLNEMKIEASSLYRFAAFRKNGTRGDIYDVDFRKQPYAVPVSASGLKAGLKAKFFNKAFDSTTLINGAPSSELIVHDLVVPESFQAPAFTIQFRGLIDVPADGIYTFYLTSDDASVLRIAGRDVVNNDGMHPPKEKNGQAVLRKGAHAFELDFIEGGGGYTLFMKYSLDGSYPALVPAEWFRHQ
jgi:hexosaminidase